ncbi:hypothetical protein Syun_006773 [Stephania yunnanensis]|uniref:Uncharacterized protein n=1 Tax=Stephania yunnanensis TaxID=152371 RepID=A0AAP0PXV5_9MAGN
MKRVLASIRAVRTRHSFDKGSRQPPRSRLPSIEAAILANRALVAGGQSPLPHAKNGLRCIMWP